MESPDRRTAGGGRVLEDDDAATLDVRTLDSTLHAVVLRLLADDEGVDVQATGGRGVHDRGGDGIRAHRQPADGVDDARSEPGLFEHVEHDVPDERTRLVVERGPAHVDVVIRCPAGGQRESAPLDGQGVDELDEPPSQ